MEAWARGIGQQNRKKKLMRSLIKVGESKPQAFTLRIEYVTALHTGDDEHI